MDNGVFEETWRRGLHKLDRKGRVDWNVAMADATFVPAKKGGECVGPTKRGPVLPYAGSKLMLLIDGKGLPLGIDLHSASPAELRLIEMLLDQHVLDPHAPRLIHDRAADSDPLRDRLADDGIQLICPHRKGRRYRHVAQDGRVLKRYRQRWKVERTIAWLGNDRRLLTRFQRYPRLFIAFAQHSANNCSCPFDINERAKVASGR